MARALILAPFSAGPLCRLRQSLHVTYESWLDTRRIYDPDELASRVRQETIKILIIEADFVFEDLFSQTDSLEFVGTCRNDTGHVDIEAATLHGIVVVNTPSRNAWAVAEHCLGLMLTLAKGTLASHLYIKEGRWQNPAEPYISMRGVELAGRTLGVVGLGAIGRRLAEIGSALGMKVVAYDPYVRQAPAGVTLTQLDDLMAQADFISLHVPLTDETEGLIDARRLSSMKPTAFLINAANASVVESGALVDLLRRRRIAGAALDVFETHPVSPDNPILGQDNVVLTPHLAGATEETIERHSQTMADDILRFLNGQCPKYLVNPEVWERRGS